MDWNELAKPYNKKPERQRAFVLNNGVPPDIADQAMIDVYAEVSNGRTFDKPADFDFAILKNAREKMAQGHRERLTLLQDNLEWSSMGKMKKVWKVITGKM